MTSYPTLEPTAPPPPSFVYCLTGKSCPSAMSSGQFGLGSQGCASLCVHGVFEYDISNGDCLCGVTCGNADFVDNSNVNVYAYGNTVSNVCNI